MRESGGPTSTMYPLSCCQTLITTPTRLDGFCPRRPGIWTSGPVESRLLQPNFAVQDVEGGAHPSSAAPGSRRRQGLGRLAQSRAAPYSLGLAAAMYFEGAVKLL